MLGSMPRISTTSRSAPGGVATENRVVGHSMRRVSPSDMRHRRPVDLEVVEVLRVERGDGLARSHTCSRCSTAAVDASAASFQPSKAAMATGERSTGRPSNSVTVPAYVGDRRIVQAGRVRKRVATGGTQGDAHGLVAGDTLREA